MGASKQAYENSNHHPSMDHGPVKYIIAIKLPLALTLGRSLDTAILPSSNKESHREKVGDG
jgi:hypothetical protein